MATHNIKTVKLESSPGFVSHIGEFPAVQYPLTDPRIYNPENIADSIKSVVLSEHRKQTATCLAGSVSRLRNIVVNPNGSLLDATGTAIDESVHDFLGDMSVEESERRSPKKNSAILVFKYGFNNYGHWLVEMLPKLHFLKDTINQNPDSKILIGNVTGGVRNIVYSTLALHGIPEESLLPIEQSTEFEELFYCTPITLHPYLMRPEIKDFYKGLAQIDTPPCDKLFVTRPPGSTRTIKALDSIEQYFSNNGYKIVDPARLSFLEQVNTFKQANEVVGIAGAAMTNAIFCAKGTKILHIVPPSMPNLFFYQLASICDHKYSELRGTSDNGDMFGKQFDVELRDLQRIIENPDAAVSN